MAEARSVFMGPRLRRLRRDLGLTQAAMAEELGVSPSYIALIERNHRPLSADLLIRLAESFDLDIAAFAAAEDETLVQLEAALSDPVFSSHSISREDIRDLASANPALGEAIAALYQSYRASERAVLEARAGAAGAQEDPVEIARDFISEHRNYFPALDEAGEQIARSLGELGVWAGLCDRLKLRHKLSVRVLPADIMVGAFRRLDLHRSQVLMSEMLDGASRDFQLALQLVLIELRTALDEHIETAKIENEAARRLARAALANYAAGAIIFPYSAFKHAADDLKYDVEALARRFGASFEQVAHRLTTLQKPGAEGVPFFFLRIDAAGNVSKRFSGGVFPFARYGGSCPLWNIHATFRTPRKIITQTAQLPDGDTFFSIARTVHGGEGGYLAPKTERAVALGCDAKYADKLVYAAAAEGDPAPIGITCRVCTRQACAARAHPPLERRLIVDEHRRMATPYSFAFD